jgi:Putative prokaryotic signal transducing protein
VTNQTVAVASVSSRAEGDIVAGLLQSEGINAWVSADDAGGEIGSLQLEGVSVLVAAADEARARHILADTSS